MSNNNSENGETQNGQYRAKEVDFAWLAGLLDGEGNIELRRKSGTYEAMSTRIRVAMCNKPCVERALRIIESITHKKYPLGESTTKTCKHMVYRFDVLDQKGCRKLCEALLPHLTAKKENAELMIAFCVARKAIKAIRPSGSSQGVRYTHVENEIFEAMQRAMRGCYTQPLGVTTERVAPQMEEAC